DLSGRRISKALEGPIRECFLGQAIVRVIGESRNLAVEICVCLHVPERVVGKVLLHALWQCAAEDPPEVVIGPSSRATLCIDLTEPIPDLVIAVGGSFAERIHDGDKPAIRIPFELRAMRCLVGFGEFPTYSVVGCNDRGPVRKYSPRPAAKRV